MDLNQHISKYLIGNSARYSSEGDPHQDLQKLIEFFRDVPISFAEPPETPNTHWLTDDDEIANKFREKMSYGEYFFTATDYVPDWNLFLMDCMTEEQSGVLSASRTARLVIELGPEDKQPRLDLILKPETDEFHTIWGANEYNEDGSVKECDASWLGLFYKVEGEDCYLEIHFCPWLP